MGDGFTRRYFIKHAGYAAAMLSASSLVGKPVELKRKDVPKRVIVIGAGLAGLVTM